jgi:hypothetical protein
MNSRSTDGMRTSIIDNGKRDPLSRGKDIILLILIISIILDYSASKFLVEDPLNEEESHMLSGSFRKIAFTTDAVSPAILLFVL